jgi:hypothetical protein
LRTWFRWENNSGIGQINNMITLTIQMPEGLARELRECAAREGVTVDQLMTAAAGEKLSALLALENLRTRACEAKRKDFVAFLNGSPDVPPLPGDELRRIDAGGKNILDGLDKLLFEIPPTGPSHPVDLATIINEHRE